MASVAFMIWSLPNYVALSYWSFNTFLPPSYFSRLYPKPDSSRFFLSSMVAQPIISTLQKFISHNSSSRKLCVYTLPQLWPPNTCLHRTHQVRYWFFGLLHQQCHLSSIVTPLQCIPTAVGSTNTLLQHAGSPGLASPTPHLLSVSSANLPSTS